MVSNKTKEESGVYQALNKALQDPKHGKINACYVIALLSGADFKGAVKKYKAESKASKASDKQAIYCTRLVSRAKMTDDDFQALRIYLVRYEAILIEMGFKPRQYTRKTWTRIERPGCYASETPALELGVNF